MAIDSPIIKGSLRIPKFHADPQQYPMESWDDHEAAITLEYQAAGYKPDQIDEDQRKAHLLIGLQGRAKVFLDSTPELRTSSYEEVLKALRKRFRVPQADVTQMHTVIQMPGETVMEFVGRLRKHAQAVNIDNDFQQIPIKQLESTSSAELEKVKPITPGERNQIYIIFNKTRDRFIFPYFQRGLRPELRAIVNAGHPHDLSKAIEIAEEHEAYTRLYEGTGTLNLINAEEQHMAQEDARVVNTAANRLQTLNRNGNHPFPQQRPSRINNSRTDPYPPRKDQWNRDRNSAKQDGNNENKAAPDPLKQTRTCYFCGIAGHYKSECRKFQRYLQQQLMENGQESQMQRRVPNLREPYHPNTREGTNGAEPGKRNLNNNRGYVSDKRRPAPRQSPRTPELAKSKNGRRPPTGGLVIPPPFVPTNRRQ